MTQASITNLSGRHDVGSKALSLQWLADNGALVPNTWFIDRPDQVERLPLRSDKKYAVRSSAHDEDTEWSAAAGVYLTELEVEYSQVTLSVERVLKSAGNTDRVAVIVQEMVDPIVSGVAFSRNPVTGLSDIVVEAIEGRGDTLLQNGADPLRWTYRNGGFTERPEQPPDKDDLALEVVAETARLAARYGPADLEWVWDGAAVHVVQIRPITAIADIPIYSRRIAKDVMPGIIKPLVWSINVPMVNTAWVRLFTEAIGPNDLDPAKLARSFAYRSYFDMRAIGDIFELMGMPRDSLENLLGLPGANGRMRPSLATFVKLPRMTRLVWRLYRGRRWVEQRRQALLAELQPYGDTDLGQLSDQRLLEQIEWLKALGEEAAYLNIVAPLLANAHVTRFRRALAKRGLDFEDLDAFPASEWDPGEAIRLLSRALDEMEPSLRARVAAGDLEAMDLPAKQAMTSLISKFGYLSESNNDLSAPRWRESPEMLVKLALATRGAVHRSRRRRWEEVVADGHRPGMRRLTRLRAAATAHNSLREATGATFAYAYGLLRPRYVEVGQRLVDRGSLAEPGDVFLVSADRVEVALEERPSLHAEVTQVKTEVAKVEDLVMPEMIVGENWIPESPQIAERLTGVGVSRGRYRGRARFVESLGDAEILEQGEVLVVEHSDVAWTPLFSLAGAVVAASGGMLAHASITAREMGIPGVASVPTARLLDGAQVLVDGFTGEVFVEEPAHG